MERSIGKSRRLVWGGAVLLLVLIWLSSAWWNARWTNELIEVGAGNGQSWGYARQENWPPAQMGWRADWTNAELRFFVYPEAKYFRCLFLPLWMGPVVVVGMGVWLRTRARRRRGARAAFSSRVRAWRLVKRGAIWVTVLLMMVWVLSIGRTVAWVSPGKSSIEVAEGAFVFCRSESAWLPRTVPGLQLMLPRKDATEWWSRARGTGYEIFTVRIALIAMIPAAAALVAWAMEWNAIRVRRGACDVCGYSRAGLESDAACPECGAAKLA